MSGSTSTETSPTVEPVDRPTKRQRLDPDNDQARDRSPAGYSSPDELGEPSNFTSSSRHKSGAQGNTSIGASERRRSSYEAYDQADESPDELDHTVHTFYRSEETPNGESRRHSFPGPVPPSYVDNEARETPDSRDLTNTLPSPSLDQAPTPVPQKPPRVYYKPKLILRGHKRGVSAVRFSPDGNWIASCSADSTIKIWDARSGKLAHTLEGHLAGISTISWSPDSKLIASGSDDKSIRLWDVATGKAYPVPFLGHHNYVYSLAFSPKGNMLVSGSYDEAVFLWDVRTARVLRSLPAHSDPVGGVDFIRDGTMVVSCAGDGLIRIWDTGTGQCLRTLVHEDNPPVVSVRFSPNGKFVLAWTLDSCVRLWNYVEGRCVKTYQGHKNSKYSITGAFGVYDSGAFAVSGSEDGDMVVWDVTSKAVLQRLSGHDGVVLGVDTHPTERMIVSGGLDGTVRIWREDEAPSEVPSDTEMASG